MLDVVFTDGRIESFDYSLPKRVTFLPHALHSLGRGAIHPISLSSPCPLISERTLSLYPLDCSMGTVYQITEKLDRRAGQDAYGGKASRATHFGGARETRWGATVLATALVARVMISVHTAVREYFHVRLTAANPTAENTPTQRQVTL